MVLATSASLVAPDGWLKRAPIILLLRMCIDPRRASSAGHLMSGRLAHATRHNLRVRTHTHALTFRARTRARTHTHTHTTDTQTLTLDIMTMNLNLLTSVRRRSCWRLLGSPLGRRRTDHPDYKSCREEPNQHEGREYSRLRRPKGGSILRALRQPAIRRQQPAALVGDSRADAEAGGGGRGAGVGRVRGQARRRAVVPHGARCLDRRPSRAVVAGGARARRGRADVAPGAGRAQDRSGRARRAVVSGRADGAHRRRTAVAPGGAEVARLLAGARHEGARRAGRGVAHSLGVALVADGANGLR